MASNITTLVEKAKQGDADAFSTLYQMYYPKMKGICINILREDKAVVDDLVQDAFILAFVSLKDLKNTHRFSQWLTSITTNLVLKYQEKVRDTISFLCLMLRKNLVPYWKMTTFPSYQFRMRKLCQQ